MTAPLSNIRDRLSNLADAARALEMAIGGAVSLDPRERDALDRLATMVAGELVHLLEELSEETEQ
jgi:hypothetical protein